MQKEDLNKNLLRSHPRNQRQQIEPRGDIENRGVRDKIYGKDAIEAVGHLSLLPKHSLLFNSICHPVASARADDYPISPKRIRAAASAAKNSDHLFRLLRTN